MRMREDSGGSFGSAAAAGVGCALAVPLLYHFLVEPYLVVDIAGSTGRAVVGYIFWWLLAGSLLAATVFAERRPVSSLGIKRLSLGLLGLAALVGVALSLLVPLVALVIDAAGGGPSDVTEVAADTVPWVLAAGVFTSAVTEEVVFRGYMLERLIDWTDQRWMSALTSLAVFVAIHVPGWGPAHVVGVVLPLGAALTGLYLWKRNLPFVIVAHLLVNAPLLVLAFAQ